MFFFALIYLAAMSSLYFYPALSGSLLLTERDLSVFFIPPRHLWVEALKAGEFPLWNPYTYSGHPLLATLQPGVLYPVNALLVLLPFDMAFNWTIIVHFFLSGVFTYLLLRDIKASGTGALIGALVFMLSGYLFSSHNLISTLFSVTWAPLVIMLYRRAVKQGSYLYAALTGISLAVMFLGGGIEVLFGTLLFLAFYTVIPCILDFEVLRAGYALPIKRFCILASAVLIFISVSAAGLFPFIELSRLSTRALGLSFNEATTWSFDFKDFVQFFIPDLYGYGASNEKYWANQSWLKTVYTGAIPLMLSAFFFLKARRKALWFILIWLFYFSLAMGRNSLFYQYLYSYFPFFNKIRYPVKFLFLPFVFAALSSGMGYDSLLKGLSADDRGFKRLVLALLAIATLAALLLAGLQYFDAGVKAFLVENGIDYPEYNRVGINIFNTKRLLFFTIVFATGVYFAFRSSTARRFLPYFAVLTLTIDLFFAHNGYYHATPRDEYYKKGEVMGYISSDTGLFRVFVTPKTLKDDITLPDAAMFDTALLKSMDFSKERVTGYNMLHRIFDINGVDVIKRSDYSVLYDLLSTQKAADSTNIPAMLNVKYVVSLPKIESKELKLQKVVGALKDNAEGIADENALKIYENMKILPRFYTVMDFRVMRDEGEYVKTLVDKKFQPGLTVLLDEEPWQTTGQGKAATEKNIRGKSSGCPVDVKEYRMNSVRLKVKCPERSLLVASESYYPGWKAYVDGAERRILKANYALRALPIEAGEHEVLFAYSPLSFRVGAYTSAGSLFILTAAGIIFYVRNRDA
ncbi:MAG: YfhO family protein [Deltaproteobacteria bacterium]|nr:YfhO family protein [Deltaproteobacteria bacterium]